MRVNSAALGVLTVYLDGVSGFLFPVSAVAAARWKSRWSCAVRAHDVTVTLEDGGIRSVMAEDGQSILDALEAHDIDAPHSCRSGLCTECAAMVTANLDNVELEAAVLDPEISARGFVLTCSATVAGPGVALELGVGDKMYEAQYGEFRKGHDDAQNSKPGKWNLPFPDVSGA
ncbi:unnamed protein product [Hapterophycus canaliculatus]